ncbi:MAG TPA: low molecular weight phosphatase family protein [Anaerolineales bacterium]|jgi:protein-tyrosine phosphatase|nr:low molecular weight phosphatase family protein [Anaerolineales bacterium]
MPNTILFICTGNYYRSRYAEIFFNDLASKMGIDWKAESRGLAAHEGYNVGPISKFALERLTQHGISPGDPIRFPMQLEEIDLREAGHIIAINRVEHQPMMEKQFPAWAEKVIYWDIADLHLTNAENALSAIEKQVHSLMENINSNP